MLWFDGGLVALWWAFSVFMLARMVTLVLRERTDAWLVLGATMPQAGRAARLTPPTS